MQKAFFWKRQDTCHLREVSQWCIPSPGWEGPGVSSAVWPGSKKTIPLCTTGRSQFRSKMAPGSSFHSIYDCRNDLSIGQTGVCCGVMCSECWSCQGYFSQGKKKGLNLLPLLLLEHLCFVGQSPRRSCQESCSLRSVQRSSQGGVDAHPALHGSSVVYFLTSFWRKTSFNDSGFSPFFARMGLWLWFFQLVMEKRYLRESRWRRWRGLSILLLHSTDCCWKSSLSLIIFFLCSQFLTMLITKTFLF